MLMLKITISLQIFVANKVLATDEIGGIKGDDESIEKCRKSSKTRKLSKSRNLKGKTLSKFKNPRYTDATEERNFFTSDIKTNFRF